MQSLAIYGSVARNQIHRKSDVDVLAKFSITPSLFTLIRMENYLSKLLGKKVDLVVENSIKPDFKHRISQDIVQI